MIDKILDIETPAEKTIKRLKWKIDVLKETKEYNSFPGLMYRESPLARFHSEELLVQGERLKNTFLTVANGGAEISNTDLLEAMEYMLDIIEE